MTDLVLNTLYITQDNCWIHHEHEVVKVKKDDNYLIQIPIHHLDSIIVMGQSSVSPSLMHKCLKKGIAINFLTQNGYFLGRVEGAPSGNVLLRKEQYAKSIDQEFTTAIALAICIGKIYNSRQNILRTRKDEIEKKRIDYLTDCAIKLLSSLNTLLRNSDLSIDEIRGIEGNSARIYFSAFNSMIKNSYELFIFKGRNKRPPRDPINALLSFHYALLCNDCICALQTIGLDPYIGFFHVEKPGRPSLALDIMEEFRPVIDRQVLTLINRGQVSDTAFKIRTGGACEINEQVRKTIIQHHQKRKLKATKHPLLNIQCRNGDLYRLQGQILARTIRGDYDKYLPYSWKA